MAAFLLVTAVAAFNVLLKTGAAAVGSAADLAQATGALQTKMEELRALPFDQLLALNGSTFAQGKGKVKVFAPLPDLLTIQAELAWAGNKTALKLVSLRSKY